MNLDWLFTPRSAWILLLVSLATLILYAVLLPVVITRLPATYFLSRKGRGISSQAQLPRGPGRVLLLVLRNILGASLILLGIALLVLPGQGLLTILVGLMPWM
jgi:hypothetical protein